MKKYKIPFNKPLLIGAELDFIRDSVDSGKISGDGTFSKKCQEFFETRYGFKKTLMTTSCTDALELGSLLADIGDGDEVIVPSFTFVSTANPFILRGARVKFCDSTGSNPNIDVSRVESLITPRTRAVVVVHYAGIAVDLDPLLDLCNRHGLFLIEDAAQAIDSYYKGRPLGSIGQIGAFSFHETKNLNCGEGGLITLNDERLVKRAEILREKGTNRTAYFRGEIDKYGWVDVGSSFLPSDLLAAFLYAQLLQLERIQNHRKDLWETYESRLSESPFSDRCARPQIPEYATNNAHMYYILCSSLDERSRMIEFLKKREIYTAFHYQSLHSSPYFRAKHDETPLPWSDFYSERLLRLPMYFGLTAAEVNYVCDQIERFYRDN